MVIAGAGGHGLEILALLRSNNSITSEIVFFDENPAKESPYESVSIIHSLEEAKEVIQKNPLFALGVGNPEIRERLDQLLSKIGGALFPVFASNAIIQSKTELADVMSFGFIGPKVFLGRGVLVNTRANIHHDCEVGDYSEIGPGSVILGGVKIGRKCRIGAGAVLLPGIEIEDNSVVGAGAVVTKNVKEGQVVAGVPAVQLIKK
jgi:sugar O-acyltransferase (sialic acid O-acetyltransferase NeuD family)